MLTGKQLQAYLAYQIHGRKEKTPRKPPAKARQSTRRGPARSEPYKRWIRTQPSIVSGLYGCDAAHTGCDGGMSMKASDLSVLPLTRVEHEEYHKIGRDAFARKYRLDLPQLVAQFNAEWDLHTLPKRKSA